MPNPIFLQLTSSHSKPETIAGWQADVYPISAAARGADEVAPPPVELTPDTVLELELENGNRLLVAAEDAERYLGKALGRDGGAPGTIQAGVIQVGTALRLSGTHLPPCRDGVGAWMLKALRIYQQGPVGMSALVAAGSIQDHLLGHRNGLYRLAQDRWDLTPVAAMPPAAEPVLLFIHGTISSTEGSFGKLWSSAARTQITAGYGERIYGFEHRTLTESPVANALALVKTLPDGARLHVVSHSRGGMIGELLARANRVGAEPFIEADFKRFDVEVENTRRKGFEPDKDGLRQLSKLLQDKAIKVERFVRVAAPLRGTTLLSGRLDRWASVMLNLLGKGLDAATVAFPAMGAAAKGFDLLQTFLLALVKERADARVLPGLEAMMPDSPLVALLNAPDVTVDFPLHVIAGNYQGDGLLSWLGDYLSEAFYGGHTDLVVNTPSMSGGAARSQGIWLKSLAGPKVYHLSYFEREEGVTPLVEALGGKNALFQRLAAPSTVEIARGGKSPKPMADGPIALILPGIMGAHLALGSEKIWFNPLNLIAGKITQLGVDAQDVYTDGWIDLSYERFAQHLAQSHEVRPFVYDWRLSIQKAADDFGRVLVQAMADAKQRKKPLRIVAHSMGGLVARLALKAHWDEFKRIPGSRLVQFGTPNRGSHSIALVLMGRDGFIQKIERWLDWKNDMKDFLNPVRNFPGVLELLPWPEDGGVDFFEPQNWLDWAKLDAENRRSRTPDFEVVEGAGDGWLPPQAKALAAARATVELLRQAPLDPECTLYVAGSNSTPMALQMKAGEVEVASTTDGDGRVPWKTGIPPGAPVWYVDAAHGDLLKQDVAFDDYVKLLETGQCSLPSKPIGSRGDGGQVFISAPRYAYGLYPTADEVLAAALCARPPGSGAEKAPTLPTTIKVVHGSLAAADTPVLIGAYAHDSLRGSAHFLDRHLQGSLSRAQLLGRYPNQPGEAMVFIGGENAKPGGAIVVGLGAIGDLKPGGLTRSLTHGLMEYARVRDQKRAPGNKERVDIELSAVLVGTGLAGLSVELGMRGLVDAIRRAGALFNQAEMSVRIDCITLYEEEESRVIAAAEALRELVRDGKNLGAVNYDGRIYSADGAYRGSCMDVSGTRGWYRVHIVSGSEDGCLRFTLVTDRARNEVSEEPDQRQAVDGLICSATNTTLDQPGLSRALFELMVPNGFKEVLHDVRGLMLSVDANAAAYPWELMRDEAGRFEAPLATRIGVVRQLASPQGRLRAPTVDNKRILVVGDTQSGLAELLGAQQEARSTATLYRDRGAYTDTLLLRPDGQSVLVNLFDGEYQVIHLAAHGTVADEKGNQDDKKNKSKYTGMVLGKDTYLTTAQISKLHHVPELVFINCCHLGSMKEDARPRWDKLAANLATEFIEMGCCCHLGSMKEDARPRWGKLAANLATEFIEMGCKAVIAAGWAVDDGAAETFAVTFHTAMLDGKPFGEAVLAARSAAFQRHPYSNTWGAYQAYGDERYRLNRDKDKVPEAPDYMHYGQVINDLDQLHARIKRVNDDEEKAEYRKRLEQIEIAAQARFFHLAAIRERLGAAWADFDDKSRAIDHYRAALAQKDCLFSLHALEQLANLEVRHGEALLKKKENAQLISVEKKKEKEEKNRTQGNELMEVGLKRLKTILSIGKTSERLSILASSWKRSAQAYHATQQTEKIADALESMTNTYLDAVDFSQQLDGERDYYPLLNAMDGVFLLATWGKTELWEKMKGQRTALLAEATRNGRNRFAVERTYFHAMSEVEALRVDALWACLDGRENEAITQDAVQDALAKSYRDLHTRFGNPREKNSAFNQIDALRDLMQDTKENKPVRTALAKLKAKIEHG